MRKNLYLQSYFYVDTVKNCPQNRIELFCLPYWGFNNKKSMGFNAHTFNSIMQL